MVKIVVNLDFFILSDLEIFVEFFLVEVYDCDNFFWFLEVILDLSELFINLY